MSYYAIMVMPRREFAAVESWTRMAVTALCPRLVERRTRRGVQLPERPMPVIPGYAFVHVAAVPPWLYRDKFVIRVLTPSIRESVMSVVLEMDGQITVDEWREVQRFKKGDRVRVKGVDAVVEDVRGHKLRIVYDLCQKLHRQTVTQDMIDGAE